MTQGDVLKKEREKRGLSLEETANRLGISSSEYSNLETGNSPVEDWGFRLAQAAITLETPTSRLLTDSGRSRDCRPGQAGELIRRHRERRGKSKEEMAAAMGISVEEYERVETGG
nr:helix-turn-helix domain-containing protein [Thermoanaerobaculia bacterium]